jgi:hypothetical protein
LCEWAEIAQDKIECPTTVTYVGHLES